MRFCYLWWCGCQLLCLASLSLAADEPPVLFSDDFSTLREGWGQPSDLKQVRDNTLAISLKQNLIHNSLYQGEDFGDIDCQVKLSQAKGEPDQSAGLIFWGIDNDNYYAARVRSDGGFLLTRRTRGKFLNPVNLKTREEVRMGLGQVNELRVATSGDRAIVFINGERVAAIKGYPPTGRSRIGLFVESGQEPCEWSFSNLVVRQGPTPTSEPPATDDALLRDNFAALDPAWGNAGGVKSVQGNKLLVTLKPNLAHHSFYQGSLYDDVDISVKITEVKGDTDQPAGLVFWGEGHEDYVTVLIMSDGTCLIRRLRKDKPPVVNSLDGPLQKGLGKTNELRIVTKADKATVFVNGKDIATYTGFPPANGSFIGLHAESGKAVATWTFSDLVVRPSK